MALPGKHHVTSRCRGLCYKKAPGRLDAPARAVPAEGGAFPPGQLPQGRLFARLRQDFVGRINRAAMHGRFWSPSYVTGSCGGAPLTIVKDYIANQKRPE